MINLRKNEAIGIMILVLSMGAGLFYLASGHLSFFNFFVSQETAVSRELLEEVPGLDLPAEKLYPWWNQPVEEFIQDSVQPENLEPNLTRPLAAVIENHPSSRPQTGLNEAELVYEFLVEGGLTRFLALYFSQVPAEIGPIRSLRSYMVETAAGYDCRLLHIGASPLGYQYLSQFQVDHLDEISRGSYYWRDSQRSRPHNIFTGRDSLPEEARDKHFALLPAGNPDSSKASVSLAVREKADKIEIRYWGGYTVYYLYNEEERNYLRFLGDASRPHLNTAGDQLSARNIIVKYVSTRVIDDIGRLKMELDSQGELLFFQQGALISGYWLKNSGGKTEYYSREGEPLEFLPGSTWIQVVPQNTEVNY